MKLLCVVKKSALIRSEFVMELVTHKNKLQNLGALDKVKRPPLRYAGVVFLLVAQCLQCSDLQRIAPDLTHAT